MGTARRTISAIWFLIALIVGASALTLLRPGGLARAQQIERVQDAGPQEVTSERSEYAKVYADPNGTYTAEISPAPVHYLADDGTWREIDDTIVETESGYENAAGPLDVEFAPNATSDDFVTISDEGKQIAFGLAGAFGLDAPQVSGNRITYENVYPGTDVVFEVVGKTVKEYLILKQRPSKKLSPPGDATFRFPVELEGLSAEEKDNGEIAFVDGDGVTAFEIPKLFMYDSAGADRAQEPAISEDLHLSVETDGGQQYIRVTVDMKWLMSSARVYPVTIDPTITEQPTLDTFVQSNILNTPQDTSTELKAGTYDGGTTKARSLIKFHLANLVGTEIGDAKLSLFNNHSWSCQARQVGVHRVTEWWGCECHVAEPSQPRRHPSRHQSRVPRLLGGMPGGSHRVRRHRGRQELGQPHGRQLRLRGQGQRGPLRLLEEVRIVGDESRA